MPVMISVGFSMAGLVWRGFAPASMAAVFATPPTRNRHYTFSGPHGMLGFHCDAEHPQMRLEQKVSLVFDRICSCPDLAGGAGLGPACLNPVPFAKHISGIVKTTFQASRLVPGMWVRNFAFKNTYV